MPRRPPRHPSSPSVRSRSLEILDPIEKKAVLTVMTNPLPLPRPRSRSLDGLIDEDGIIADLKSDNSTILQNSITKSQNRSQSLNEFLEKANNQSNNLIDSTYSNDNPFPLPRNRRNSSVTKKFPEIETVNDKNPISIIQDEDLSNSTKMDRSISDDECKIKNEFPNIENIDQFTQCFTKIPLESKRMEQSNMFQESAKTEESKNLQDEGNKGEQSKLITEESKILPNELEIGNLEKLKTQLIDKNSEKNNIPERVKEKVEEKLSMLGNEKSTLSKAKSCGAGLDSDENNYTPEYKPVIKSQGSLLSLSTGSDPKRKRNFMDKCVNKVRSFIKKND